MLEPLQGGACSRCFEEVVDTAFGGILSDGSSEMAGGLVAGVFALIKVEGSVEMTIVGDISPADGTPDGEKCV